LIVVQGTSFRAGKRRLVAALSRIASDQGFNVAPSKAQDVSLSSPARWILASCGNTEGLRWCL
jgi:cobyric acid synthase